MGFRKIKEYVPVFYHRFLPVFFESEVPAEAFSKCEDCPMVCESRDDLQRDVSKPFAPDTKCCTFIPRLPNYFVGAFLNDPQTIEAKNLLIKRIEEKRGVFPQGIYPDKKYALLYELGRKEGFGKSKSLKCPYFKQGEFNCSLWKYRESVCATWFCKYLAADTGRNFWNEMRNTFKTLQEKLLTHVLMKLGLNDIFPYGEDEQLNCEDLDDLPMNIKEYNMRWQHWSGNEVEFYRQCHELINNLTINDFNEIAGEEYLAHLKSLDENYNLIMTLPESLTIHPDYVFEAAIPGTYRLKMHSYMDRNDTIITYAFDIPSQIIDSFRTPDNINNVLKLLSDEHNIELGRDMLLALYHNEILIAG